MSKRNSYKQLETRISELEKLLNLKTKQSEIIKTLFVANVSHEIRTPLNAIIGFSGLIASDELTFSKRREYLTQINNSSERLLKIIDNLMDLTLLESNDLSFEYSECRIDELIFDMYNFINQEKRNSKKNNIAILYNCSVRREECNIITDRFRLQQVIQNLLQNAIKFTVKGVIEFGCIRDKDIIQFYVKDSGIGGLVPGDNSIFESFAKADGSVLSGSEGLGIGLTISRGIISKMNGNIWFETNIYNGTTFYFTIPIISKNDTKFQQVFHKERLKNKLLN